MWGTGARRGRLESRGWRRDAGRRSDRRVRDRRRPHGRGRHEGPPRGTRLTPRNCRVVSTAASGSGPWFSSGTAGSSLAPDRLVFPGESPRLGRRASMPSPVQARRLFPSCSVEEVPVTAVTGEPSGDTAGGPRRTVDEEAPMVARKRSTKAPHNPYLTAATPDELAPANGIAYD